jgi:integrase
MLTDAKIKALPTPERDRLIPAGDRTGLYLRVRTTGRRTWVTRRRIGGAWRVDTLGDWPALTALNARRMANTTETRQVDAIKFGQAVEDFYREAIETRYRSKPLETKAYLVRDCARLHPMRLDRVTRADVVNVIRAKAATAPNAAAKLLAIVKQFFGWCLLGGLIPSDPTAGLTGRKLLIPAQQPRERKLTDDEVRALWAMPAEPYGRLLRFVLLTGCRIGEAIQFDASQVTGDVWTIPMTKNGRAHTLPLTPTAAKLCAEGWPHRSYEAVYSYFTLKAIPWRPHDLRRTAATRLRVAGVSSDTIEAVLNHAPGKLLRTYQQPDMVPSMRAALLALDANIAAVLKGPAS